MYRVLDLFAGAGGMSLGFQQTSKFEIAVAFEKNLNARLTYELNHKNTVALTDVFDIKDYDDFKMEYGEFDVVMGGPPCQGFSNANRQKNYLVSQNNILVKKFVEIIENLKPKAFVLENVRMLQSKTHRFYQTISDQVEIKNLDINLRKDTIFLFDGICPITDIGKLLQNDQSVSELLLPDKTFNKLRLFLKKSYDENKRSQVIVKKGNECIKAIASLPPKNSNIPEEYKNIEENGLTSFVEYIVGNLSFEEAEPRMSTFIMIQQLLSSFNELRNNNILIDHMHINDRGVSVDVQSYSIIDYIKGKLEKHYRIDDDVLNAAWFGAPQLRERYIAIGIREDLARKYNITPELPKAEYKPEEYRTVSDAILDLENIPPGYSIKEEGILLPTKCENQTVMTSYLRNSNKLYNHIATETRATALKRFSVLKPGQNFHDLDPILIEDTYSLPERTQNSIYLRLQYDKPCGTVTNVRKSMWIHPVKNRAISIREAARLQTFPDSFEFAGNKDSQYQQVGNAVPPLMAKAIANKVSEMLDATLYDIGEFKEGLHDDGYVYSGKTQSSNVENTLPKYGPRDDCEKKSAYEGLSVQIAR